jgi:tetratricopeptide (TPR) repeat protein
MSGKGSIYSIARKTAILWIPILFFLQFVTFKEGIEIFVRFFDINYNMEETELISYSIFLSLFPTAFIVIRMFNQSKFQEGILENIRTLNEFVQRMESGETFTTEDMDSIEYKLEQLADFHSTFGVSPDELLNISQAAIKLGNHSKAVSFASEAIELCSKRISRYEKEILPTFPQHKIDEIVKSQETGGGQKILDVMELWLNSLSPEDFELANYAGRIALHQIHAYKIIIAVHNSKTQFNAAIEYHRMSVDLAQKLMDYAMVHNEFWAPTIAGALLDFYRQYSVLPKSYKSLVDYEYSSESLLSRAEIIAEFIPYEEYERDNITYPVQTGIGVYLEKMKLESNQEEREKLFLKCTEILEHLPYGLEKLSLHNSILSQARYTLTEINFQDLMIENFEKMESLIDDNRDLHHELYRMGTLFFDLNKYELAIKYLSKSHEISTDINAIHMQVFELLFLQYSALGIGDNELYEKYNFQVQSLIDSKVIDSSALSLYDELEYNLEHEIEINNLYESINALLSD